MARNGNGNGSALATLDNESEVQTVDLHDTPAALGEITRAEIDAQVATARRFPRSVKRALDEATALATRSKTVAAACTYAKPRGGKMIIGPSVRLAEIMAYSWGNLRTASRLIKDDGRTITVEAVCIDLERNSGVAVHVTRSVVDRNGRRYSDDQVNTTSMAAVSVGFRNAVFRTIPTAFIHEIWQEAQATATGGAETFAAQRDRWLDHFTAKKIAPERVFRALGVVGADDIGFDQLSMLQGLDNAIRDGEITADEAFPPLEPVRPTRTQKGADGLLDRLGSEPREPGED